MWISWDYQLAYYAKHSSAWPSQIFHKCTSYNSREVLSVISIHCISSKSISLKSGVPISLNEVHSVRFSRSFVSNLCDPHGLQYARHSCPSPTPGDCSDSCPLSQWCHPTITSSIIPFSFCLQSSLASKSFPNQFFSSGGQSIRASAPVLPMNIQDWFPLGWTRWISLQCKGHSRIFSNTAVQKHQFFYRSAFFLF